MNKTVNQAFHYGEEEPIQSIREKADDNNNDQTQEQMNPRIKVHLH